MEKIKKIEKIKRMFLVSGLSLTLISSVTLAFSINENNLNDNQIKTLQVQQDQLKKHASAWGLKVQEFKHYQWLMQHTPSGQWYKTLDPPEVLALNSKHPNDMWRYAQIQAHNMHVRVMRELAFNQLYTKAYRTLYPTEEAIRTPNDAKPLSTTLTSGDHVWLFLTTTTKLGAFVYQRLMDLVQKTPNTVLDIYFVGPHTTNARIQLWAASVNLLPTLLNLQVTLNKGRERFQAVTQGKQTPLPYVGVVHHGHFQPILLSSIA